MTHCEAGEEEGEGAGTVYQGYVAKKVILVGQLSDGYINVTPMCQAKGKRYHDWGQRGELVPWWLVPI